MAARLDHTIIWARDKAASAAFLTDILGLPEPVAAGPFQAVALDNGVTLDFGDTEREIAWQHYAFLIDDAAFDAAFARIRERGLDYWADPGRQRRGEINHAHGGRGLYFTDPDGHLLEILTRHG